MASRQLRCVFELPILAVLVFGVLAVMVPPSRAATVNVNDAKIVKVQFYGAQFTVYIDKSHGLSSCGSSDNLFALDSSSNAGQPQTAALLTAWSASKKLQVVVTDDICNGDRPTVSNFSVYD